MEKSNGLSKLEELSEIEKHFKEFIREKRFIANLSERTIRSYEKDVFGRWKKIIGLEMPNKENLTSFILGMREAGISVGTCNLSIRSFNSFLSWLQERDVVPAGLRLKKLKEEQKVMRTFSNGQLKELLAWKPNLERRNEVRIFVLTRLLLDTGCRISEALSLRVDKIDLDNLIITVMGKGRKQRVLPISLEMRKTIYLYMSKYRQSTFTSDYLICTSSGLPWSYQNARRELMRICEKLDISWEEIDGFFHCFRRKFARSYVAHGGNLLYLQQVMGHSSLQMTKAYVTAEDEELHIVHQRTSILSRLK